ncbi:hypothetical protein DRO66_05875 [Candidatus Bathyarchaeota archaeon]|nr:MAG: hypothetical protein DRO66_05875 [Candidatus Bathyarchaeota archaeon]
MIIFPSSFLLENLGDLQGPVRRVASTLIVFRSAWGETLFEHKLKNLRGFLTNTSEKPEDLTRRLDAQNPISRVDQV